MYFILTEVPAVLVLRFFIKSPRVTVAELDPPLGTCNLLPMSFCILSVNGFKSNAFAELAKPLNMINVILIY